MVPSFSTSRALSALASLIAAIESSRVVTGLPSALPLMAIREQMLAEHPTPSNVAVRVVPSDMVILAVNPHSEVEGRSKAPAMRILRNVVMDYLSLRTASMSASYSALLHNPAWMAAIRPDLSMMSVSGTAGWGPLNNAAIFSLPIATA
jgi:hypothetical protein